MKFSELEEKYKDIYRNLYISGLIVNFSVVEVKTAVKSRSLGAVIPMAGKYMTFVHIYDEAAHDYIPREHIAQMTHQILVTNLNVGVYFYRAESGIAFTILLYFSPDQMDRIKYALV